MRPGLRYPADGPRRRVTVVVPTARPRGYLEVTLASLRRQRTRTPHRAHRRRRRGDATPPREVAERFGVRADPPRRAAQPRTRRATPACARRAPTWSRSWTTTCWPRPAGWTRSWRARPAIPTRRRSAARSGRASRATPRAAAAARTRRSRRSTSGPRTWRREMVWGANFAVRRSAVERVGEFDETLDRGHGDEEEWLLRLRAAGGRIVYLADAGLDHRAQPRRRRPALARAGRLPPRARCALERPAPRRRPGPRRASCACWPAAAGTRCAAPARREWSWAPTRPAAWWRRCGHGDSRRSPTQPRSSRATPAT